MRPYNVKIENIVKNHCFQGKQEGPITELLIYQLTLKRIPVLETILHNSDNLL